MEPEEKIKLQVLISTYSIEGIERLASTYHPRIEGIEYLVSWQLPDGDSDVPEVLTRPDFRIIKNTTRGLSCNRNISLETATAPVCLLSDDDVDYDEDGLKRVMDIFDENPDLDIAAFEYEGDDNKIYPMVEMDLKKTVKGYYISSIELAFRRDVVVSSGIRFDERFGVGGRFIGGEEDIWVHGLLKKGLKGKFFPQVIAYHKGTTTGTRLVSTPEYIESKGAVFKLIYPFSWPLRMFVHALKSKKTGWRLGIHRYCREWISGVSEVSK